MLKALTIQKMDKSIMSKLILEFLYERDKNGASFQLSGGIPSPFFEFSNKKDLEIDPKKDERIFRETFWQLFSQNLATIGFNDANHKLPWVSITEYGIKCFEKGMLLPYDPEGFLNSLQSKIPKLDSIIELYFGEAMSCFSNRNFLASAVMIGGAIERTIILLTENFAKSLNEEKLSKFEKEVLK